MISENKTLSKEPFVVVLILSYNGKHLLDEAVSSYLENSYSNFKVVVIDNGSDDGTFDFLKNNFSLVEVIRLEKNKGYSGGFNHGIKYAKTVLNADYILISNNDVRIDNQAISALVETAEDKTESGFVTGKVFFYEKEKGHNIIQTLGRKKHPIFMLGAHIGAGEKDLGQYDKITERHFCDDVFILVNTKLITDVGMFDENFVFQHEESDWQSRAKKKGYKIYYTPDAKLWHKVGMTTGGTDSPLRHYNSKKNAILFVKRNGNFYQNFLYLFFMMIIYLPFWSIRFIIDGRIDLTIASLKGFVSGLIWLLTNTPQTLIRKKL